MADFKISGLPSYTPTGLNDGDLFVINDATNPSTQVTKSITAEKLAEAIAPGTGGTRQSSYMSFFNDTSGNNTNQTAGLQLTIDSFNGDAGTPKDVNGGTDTLSFQAPANSIGAYIFFSARIQQDPSPSFESQYGAGTAAVKTFMTCTLNTPGAYWNTRATQQPNNTQNGFSIRMYTTVPGITGGTFNDKFSTYHAAKWDTVEWASVSSVDRTLDMTVKWRLERANFTSIKFGMNRVIVIPLYEDPTGIFSRSNTVNYVDPVSLVAPGVTFDEFYLRDEAHAQQFFAAYDAVAKADNDKDELSDRTIALKKKMDTLIERIQSYEAAGNSDSTGVLATAKTELGDIKGKAAQYTTVADLTTVEQLVQAQVNACAPVLDITFGFESLLS